MKTYVHLQDLSELFLESEIFQTQVVQKIKTHSFQKPCSLWDNVKYVEPDWPQMTI
jgi:hypothetical protein